MVSPVLTFTTVEISILLRCVSSKFTASSKWHSTFFQLVCKGPQFSDRFWLQTCLQIFGSRGYWKKTSSWDKAHFFWHHLISIHIHSFLVGIFLEDFPKSPETHTPKKSAPKPCAEKPREFRLKEDALFRASLNEGGNEKRVVAAPRCTRFSMAGGLLGFPTGRSAWHGSRWFLFLKTGFGHPPTSCEVSFFILKLIPIIFRNDDINCWNPTASSWVGGGAGGLRSKMCGKGETGWDLRIAVAAQISSTLSFFWLPGVTMEHEH